MIYLKVNGKICFYAQIFKILAFRNISIYYFTIYRLYYVLNRLIN